MRYYYATVSSNSHNNLICTGLINTYAEMHITNYIKIDTYNDSLIGKMWTGSEWVENPNPPEV